MHLQGIRHELRTVLQIVDLVQRAGDASVFLGIAALLLHGVRDTDRFENREPRVVDLLE